MAKFWQNTTYRFLILFLGIFALLYYANIAFIGLVAPGGYYVPFFDNHLNYIEGLRSFLLNATAFVLKSFGHRVVIMDIWLRVPGRGGFNMAYDCLGYGVMSFFTAFVLAYPKSIRSKIWFLPLGLVLIQTLNVIRFVFLGLYWNQSGLRKVIDHHDMFNIVLYITLLGVIYLWINQPAKVNYKTEQDSIHETNSAAKSV